MTNVELLRQVLDRIKPKRTQLAAAMGVSMPTFYSRISGKSEFTAPEILALSNALGLTKEERDAIFFAVMVN